MNNINLFDYIKTYFRPPLSDVYFINNGLKLDVFEHKFYTSNPKYKDNDYGYYIIRVNDKDLGIVQNLSTDLVEILYTLTKEFKRQYDDISYCEGGINIIDTQKLSFPTSYDRVKHFITFKPIVKMN